MGWFFVWGKEVVILMLMRPYVVSIPPFENMHSCTMLVRIACHVRSRTKCHIFAILLHWIGKRVCTPISLVGKNVPPDSPSLQHAQLLWETRMWLRNLLRIVALHERQWAVVWRRCESACMIHAWNHCLLEFLIGTQFVISIYLICIQGLCLRFLHSVGMKSRTYWELHMCCCVPSNAKMMAMPEVVSNAAKVVRKRLVDGLVFGHEWTQTTVQVFFFIRRLFQAVLWK